MRSRHSTRSSSAVAFVLLVVGCGKPHPTVMPARPADPVQQLSTDLASIIDRPGLQRATWGIVVQSLDRSNRLFELNAHKLLIPASTMKLVSLATASEAVGWEYTFETTLLAAGRINDGVLHGDLVIAGSGDPSVFGRPMDDDAPLWIDALREHGITRIDGRVIGDDNAVEEPRPGFAWSWDDLGYDYGAIPGALNLGENIITINVIPGALEGTPTRLQLPAEAGNMPIVNRTTTAAPGATGFVWPEQRPGESHLTISGSLPAESNPVALSVSTGNPTQWVAEWLHARLIASGIDVAGPAMDVDDLAAAPDLSTATVIYSHRSHTLRDIAVPLMKDSINLYAEAVLRLATGSDGQRMTDAGIGAAHARLHAWGIPDDGIQMVDGSGLSRRDVVAPETLVLVLQHMYDPSWGGAFMSALPIAGRDGTLGQRMKATLAEGNAIAKTGSLSNVRTLAGYVRTMDGEPLAFAIIVNNFEGAGSAAVDAIDAIVVRLASFSRFQVTSSY
jgi:serine-type D-Ala-D-Ala carboxypeptidase/endopeptidase (penicillin-binding protein 4)